MRVKINSVHFKTDQKLEVFIKEKVEKLASTYDNVVGSDVTLKVSNATDDVNKVAEIRLAIPGNDLYAKKQCRTFEEATDSAIDALRKQLNKHKDKLKK
jgi:putative sigma-54 modulation protein